MRCVTRFLTFCANALLNTVGREHANQYLDGIMDVREVRIVDGRPTVTFTLAGIPEHELTATVGTVDISEDGRSVRLGDFSSNAAFLENALNRLVTRPIPIRNAWAALVLRMVRSFLFQSGDCARCSSAPGKIFSFR